MGSLHRQEEEEKDDVLATAYIDEQLLVALGLVNMDLKQEYRQVILLGCGFDTRPYRCTIHSREASNTFKKHASILINACVCKCSALGNNQTFCKDSLKTDHSKECCSGLAALHCLEKALSVLSGCCGLKALLYSRLPHQPSTSWLTRS